MPVANIRFVDCIVPWRFDNIQCISKQIIIVIVIIDLARFYDLNENFVIVLILTDSSVK